MSKPRSACSPICDWLEPKSSNSKSKPIAQVQPIQSNISCAGKASRQFNNHGNQPHQSKNRSVNPNVSNKMSRPPQNSPIININLNIPIGLSKPCSSQEKNVAPKPKKMNANQTQTKHQENKPRSTVQGIVKDQSEQKLKNHTYKQAHEGNNANNKQNNKKTIIVKKNITVVKHITVTKK